MRSYKVTEDCTMIGHPVPEVRMMTLTQQWRYLNFTRTSFPSYFFHNVYREL